MSTSTLPAVLTIAGSDSSGGAGIQADIKTIAAHGLFAECAITAITAQNTCGVCSIQNIDPAIVADQIDMVLEELESTKHRCRSRHGGNQRCPPYR